MLMSVVRQTIINLMNWDRAVARAVTRQVDGGAAGAGFEFCSTHDLHRGFSHINGAVSLFVEFVCVYMYACVVLVCVY